MAEQAAEFKCDECGATFKDADSLAKHQAVHEEQDEKESGETLEQGTEKPTVDPSMPGPGPVL